MGLQAVVAPHAIAHKCEQRMMVNPIMSETTPPKFNARVLPPTDLQNLPEDPAIRPMLISNGVPRHLWPEGWISEAQAAELIRRYGVS